MAPTRKQVVTGISVAYLAILTGLAAYALHSANTYSLPIPNAICALTIALPPLAGIALETVLSLNDSLAKKGHVQASRAVQVVVAFFLVFESVLATLAGAHYSPPGSLNCALGERWHEMHSHKDATSIRRIQDTFTCCGFRSTLDMAWPFDDATHGHDACVVRYERNSACLEPWRNEERKVGIMLMVVPMAVFLWKVAILLAPSSQSSWLPSHIRLPDENSGTGSSAARRPRAAIGYHDVEGQGQGQGQEEGPRREDSVQRAVTGLNKDSHLASHVEGNRTRTRPGGLLNDANMWREEDADV